MTPEELAAVRGRLEEFAAEVFAPLARVDQRDKGVTYLRGLLLDGRRKSMQPMAERLGSITRGCSSSSPRPPSRWPRSASGWPARAIEGDQPGCVGDRRHQLSTDRHRAARRGRLTASALALRRLSATLMRVAQLRIATWERRPRFV
jgi:hypothetical protein